MEEKENQDNSTSSSVMLAIQIFKSSDLQVFEKCAERASRQIFQKTLNIPS